MNKGIYEICGEIKGETAKAILFSDGITEAWLPKSQVEYDEDKINKYKEITIMISEWWARKKGFL